MPDWKTWHEMAQHSFEAGVLLQEVNPRSAVNRYYYSAYQDATACLLFFRLQPPRDREVWNHTDTPRLLKAQLLRARVAEATAEDTRDKLGQLYKVRCDADYVSAVPITISTVEKVRAYTEAIRLEINKILTGA